MKRRSLHQVLDDGQGGKILAYTWTREWSSSGRATTRVSPSWHPRDPVTATTTYDPPRTYSSTSYRMFWVNRQGYVYRWAWRGL